jgi:hypothetical protein
MNRIYLLPISLAVLWIIIKQMAFILGLFTFGSVQLFVLMNMFLLTFSIALALYKFKKTEENPANFMQDVKKGIAAGMIYNLIVSGFIYLFYAKIHPEYNQYQIDQAKELLENPKNLEKIRAKNPDMKNKSDAEIKKMSLMQVQQIASAGFTFVLALLGLTLYSILNSIVISVIYRKLLFKTS